MTRTQRGVLLYGPPATGKDTITQALSRLDPNFQLFSRLKAGPGRSAGYRMATQEQLEELRRAGAVVYENARYDSTYVTDRPGLDDAFAAGVPVMHLGQVDGVQAVLSGYAGDWLTVLLWCPREVTEARSIGRGDADTPARLAAWDATRADLDANPRFRFDLTIRTDEVGPEAAAAQIRQALTAPRGDLVMVDFDDTLIDRLSAVAAWVAGYCTEHGLDPVVEQRMLEAMRIRADVNLVEGLCAELGLPESAGALWARYEPELAASVKPFPGVIEALTAVREAGHQVVVVTNGGGKIQRAKLTASGIADAVGAVCISEEVGARKPDRQIFEAAAASVGRDLSQGGWMIGDNADLDVAGGRKAGLRTVWISHGHPWPGGVKPDHVAPTAAEAFAFVRGGGR
ncbi:HAD-IA family hydrolase [Streptomyces kaniharaensis]|uniref:HAD-IA family hydrolase n=1 Tax=Streptomyces kaniharaensis TaxID=212423 RepID=A0A6N7L4P5_9ACTN|nr:HAD-IA family hydrolase [Streptomyces kaniharaensis]MQS17869.1 HAD-IA family hydrolase [Streptomyces kaniharaensis]